MPQFPHSKYTTSASTGAFVRQQGSHSPSIEVDESFPDIGFLHPFKITIKKVDGVNTVFVRAGTVNNVVPTIDDTYLDDPDNPGIAIATPNTESKYVALKVTGSTGEFFPEYAEIVIVNSLPVNNTDSNGYLILGSFLFGTDGRARISQFVYTSQIAIRAKPGTGDAIWLFSSR
jgi:hypothetical protein